MVYNLTLPVSNFHRSNMSITSSTGSIDSANSSVEIEATSFQDIPLTALSKSSRKKLSHLMNSKKILRSEEGYERDWRGLAFLAKQKSLCDENCISGDDPMSKVIQLWCNNNPNTATFGYLEKFLGIIDRWDVCDDIFENLVQDTKTFQSNCKKNTFPVDTGDYSLVSNVDFGHGADPNILTTDDVIRAKKGLSPQMYDAFVLYADVDINYVTEMLTKLEDNAEYNFKLCIKDRDLLAGVAFKHVALTQLIEERCKYLIVILTNAFLKSAENKFFVDFTQALQIEHKTRKIIPLIYENTVDIPKTLNIYTHLRYNTGSIGFCDYWTKLANSIRNVNIVEESGSKSSVWRNEARSTPVTQSRAIPNAQQDIINRLPSPPTEIPSINLNGHELVPVDMNKENPKHVQRTKLRTFTNRNSRANPITADAMVLRSAHSTGQLHTSYYNNEMSSVSNISNTCESKKRKWSKLLSKVFSRSSSKLQQQTD